MLTSIHGRCFDLTSQATWRTTRWLPVQTRLRIATRCVPTQAPGVRLPIPDLLPPLQPLSISPQPTGVGQPHWDREKLFLPLSPPSVRVSTAACLRRGSPQGHLSFQAEEVRVEAQPPLRNVHAPVHHNLVVPRAREVWAGQRRSKGTAVHRQRPHDQYVSERECEEQ